MAKGECFLGLPDSPEAPKGGSLCGLGNGLQRERVVAIASRSVAERLGRLSIGSCQGRPAARLC